MSTETDNARPVEGDRCAQCDRVFEFGEDVRSEAVPQRHDDRSPVRFRHYHNPGCWTMVHLDIKPPAVSRNAGQYGSGGDSKAAVA